MHFLKGGSILDKIWKLNSQRWYQRQKINDNMFMILGSSLFGRKILNAFMVNETQGKSGFYSQRKENKSTFPCCIGLHNRLNKVKGIKLKFIFVCISTI